MDCNKVPTGLYPRKAAKSAPDAGVELKAVAISDGAPASKAAEDNAAGKVALRDTIIIEKNMAWLIVWPTFCRVDRMPEPAPRCSAGIEFMIDAMLGDIKMPLPIPITNRITANGK